MDTCCQDFMAIADDKYKKLKDDYELLEQKFDELATFYCFDKKKTTMEEFFGDITAFVKDFEVSAFWRGTVGVACDCVDICIPREHRRRMRR